MKPCISEKTSDLTISSISTRRNCIPEREENESLKERGGEKKIKGMKKKKNTTKNIKVYGYFSLFNVTLIV